MDIHEDKVEIYVMVSAYRDPNINVLKINGRKPVTELNVSATAWTLLSCDPPEFFWILLQDPKDI